MKGSAGIAIAFWLKTRNTATRYPKFEKCFLYILVDMFSKMLVDIQIVYPFVFQI